MPFLVRKTMKMPFLSDGAIYLGVKMTGESAQSTRYAIVQIPVSSAARASSSCRPPRRAAAT